MDSLRVGISTQTPLLKFERSTATEPDARAEGHTEGPRFQLSPGGVSRMVLGTVRHWLAQKWASEVHWYSLQPTGPRRMKLEDPPIELHHLALPAQELAAYARTKEKLWADIHGLPSPRFEAEDFRFYSRYNWFTADAILEQSPNLDVVYAHDFQLLQVGALVGLAAPVVMRWHVPFVAEGVPSYTRNFLARLIEDFDAVIVSTERELAGLRRAGFRGFAHQIYPHIEPQDWPRIPPSTIASVEHEFGLQPDDPLLLVVARMDPMKRQDIAIRAIARLADKHPRARLVLVGNGSFSSASGAGLGMTKAQEWSQRLQALVRELKVEDRVTFAHWIADDRLAPLYARADAVLLPSDLEGFGITVLEAWQYARPVVVSAGAGVAEVIEPGEEGLVFPAGSDESLARNLDVLLSDREAARRMGEAGHAGLRRFDARHQAHRVQRVLEAAIERYRSP